MTWTQETQQTPTEEVQNAPVSPQLPVGDVFRIHVKLLVVFFFSFAHDLFVVVVVADFNAFVVVVIRGHFCVTLGRNVSNPSHAHVCGTSAQNCGQLPPFRRGLVYMAAAGTQQAETPKKVSE